MTATMSRVVDTRKKITSHSGLSRASKARDTLETAQQILLKSGSSADALNALQVYINELSTMIHDYYRS